MENAIKKVVLVTGASTGLGAAIAKVFAKQKAFLCITGRNKENLENVAKECQNLGAEQVLTIVADLSTKEGIEQTFQQTIDKFQKLDILINNAGIWLDGTVETVKFDDYDKLFAVNVRAPLFLTQLCVPYLETSQGNVVNISSIDSQAHYTNSIAYGMSKSALDQFTKNAALELSSKGIRVNAVNPGLSPTNIFVNRQLDISTTEHFDKEGKFHPLRQRCITPEEIADAVCFLSSDSAKMITGVCLNVDGGRVLTGQ